MLLCTLCAAWPYQPAYDNAGDRVSGDHFVTLQLALYLRLIQLETRYRIEEARLFEGQEGGRSRARLPPSREVRRSLQLCLSAGRRLAAVAV